MKKTQSIDLGGKMFILEEDAYLILSDYLAKVSEHIGRDVDADEVMSDIEISMSEKMREKLSSEKEAVTKIDIEAIIAVMGTVEDFQQNFDSENAEKEDGEGSDTPGIRRLYRDTDNRMIAGVCSGIAAYFGKDPFIVRLLFLALFVFGNGIGFPLYLAFWIIIPSAKTTAQKLEMEGKAATISSISRSRKEKPESARSEKPGEADYLMRRVGSALVYLFGLFLVIGSLTVIFASTTGAGVAYRYAHDYSFFNDVPIAAIEEIFPLNIFLIISVLLCSIPAFAILVAGGAIILRKKIMNSAFLVSLIAIWIFFGFLAAYMGMSSFGRLQDVFYESERVKYGAENISLEAFDSVTASGRFLDVEVLQGNAFSMTAAGRKIDLENFSYEVKDGSLVLSENDRGIAGDCLACHQETIRATIAVPDIKAVKADRSDCSLSGNFKTLAAEAKDSYLNMDGNLGDVSFVLDGSDLYYQGSSEKISIKASDGSRIDLLGNTGALAALLQQGSILSSLGLDSETVSLDLSGDSWAAVNPLSAVSGSAKDGSGICYLGVPDLTGLTLENLATLKHLQRISSYDYSRREDAETRYFYDGNYYYMIDKDDENAYAGEAERIESIFGA